ncbi:MAG: hypothetical protein ACRD2W_01700 [Acidimicrobiales bacterium]
MHRLRAVLGMAVALWAIPRPAFAHGGHGGHCNAGESITSLGIGTFLGLMLFRPWRKSDMNGTAKATRWLIPGVVASLVTLGACGGDSGSSRPRPQTAARLEITQPTPNQNVAPTFTLTLNLLGAKVVDADKTTGPLRPDEGHIHVTLDGKLVSMTYGTSQEMKDIAPGPHNLQAEFVATDHAPFANRVIVAVAFNVNPTSPANASPS